jgi:uncharacterized surface protein with fasciclin (FAS1) repeats
MQTITEALKDLRGFSLFFKAAAITGVINQLTEKGPWTIFLPTDQAFRQLPPKILNRLFKKNKGKLAALVACHIVRGNLTFSEILYRKNFVTLGDSRLNLHVSEEIEITLEDAKIIQADIICKNGVIHIIDSVLIPPINTVGHNPPPL